MESFSNLLKVVTKIFQVQWANPGFSKPHPLFDGFLELISTKGKQRQLLKVSLPYSLNTAILWDTVHAASVYLSLSLWAKTFFAYRCWA